MLRNFDFFFSLNSKTAHYRLGLNFKVFLCTRFFNFRSWLLLFNNFNFFFFFLPRTIPLSIRICPLISCLIIHSWSINRMHWRNLHWRSLWLWLFFLNFLFNYLLYNFRFLRLLILRLNLNQ